MGRSGGVCAVRPSPVRPHSHADQVLLPLPAAGAGEPREQQRGQGQSGEPRVADAEDADAVAGGVIAGLRHHRRQRRAEGVPV